MGKDKFENEDLIKYAYPEDVHRSERRVLDEM